MSNEEYTPIDRAKDDSAPVKKEETVKPKSEPRKLVSTLASAVEMTAVEWFWENRFAIGKLGLIVGLPDEGKGQILSYVAAQTTHGGKWPVKEGHAPIGNVLIFSDEDDADDTLVPRLAAAGADRDHVHLVKMVRSSNKDRMFSLITDLDLLRQKILEIGDIKLVLIDPISAYLGIGKIDSFRQGDVRAVITPLVNLASELRVAIIGVMHFNKKTEVTNALLRISDSLAFGAVARHVYGVVDDNANERKLFVRAKNNIAAKSKHQTLSFRFEENDVGIDQRTGKHIWAPYIVWSEDYIDVSAFEAMQAVAESKAPAARDDAMFFLLEMLKKGPVLVSEIEEAAKANGISHRTLVRAKADLKISAKKSQEWQGKWVWELPKGTRLAD